MPFSTVLAKIVEHPFCCINYARKKDITVVCNFYVTNEVTYMRRFHLQPLEQVSTGAARGTKYRETQ